MIWWGVIWTLIFIWIAGWLFSPEVIRRTFIVFCAVVGVVLGWLLF